MNSTPTQTQSAYVFTLTMHNDLMAVAYQEDPRFVGHEWRRLCLIDIYHRLKAEGYEHQLALDTAWSAIKRTVIDEDGNLHVDSAPGQAGLLAA